MVSLDCGVVPVQQFCSSHHLVRSLKAKIRKKITMRKEVKKIQVEMGELRRCHVPREDGSLHLRCPVGLLEPL